jgi:crotonobetainyl-CoA:carnitine CoA-transferase CaiB-like acyl-CoA transferase
MRIEKRRSGPLADVRVLELGQIAAGPYAGSLLADLGADVVKIENPNGGDGMRGWPPLSSADGGASYSENFASLNRNKRSVALDLKKADDVTLLKQLVEVADIFIENYRAGVLARLGLGYDDLRAINPKLVYCSISGYGQNGPYAPRGAFDVTVQAISGLMSITGHDGMPPVKCGVPVADFAAGLYGAYVVIAALRSAEKTGRGAHIDCSMLGALLGIAALQTSEYFGTGRSIKPMGSAHPRNAPYQAFRSKDEYFVIAAGNESLWNQVAEAVGMPELVEDPRFRTQVDRATNQDELRQILEVVFVTRGAQHWIAEMDRRGVPCAPINTYADVMNDPHVKHMNLVREMYLPNGVKTNTIAFPVNISEVGFDVYRAPPELGAHNEEVASEWGIRKMG